MTGPSASSSSRRLAGRHHDGVVFTPTPLARRLAAPLARPGARLLDPACGDGSLLLAAFESLRSEGRPDERRPGAEAGGLVLHGIELRPELAARARRRLVEAGALTPEQAETRIRCADALDPTCCWPEGAHVLANPPWLSFSGRHAAAARNPAASELGGWPSLQGAFLHRIARHCGEHGVSARLLLPGSLLELERYGPARAAALAHAHLAAPPEELGESAFPGVTDPAVLVSLAPGARADAPSPATPAELAPLTALPPLPPETFADSGVHTGNAARELVLAAGGPNTAPLRRGADLRAFALGAPSQHLRLDLERSPSRRFRIAPLERYRSFPILLRQTADRPIAALHVEPTYFRNSLLGVRAVPGLAAEFVVAWLNCELTARWHRARFRDARQRSFPQVKVAHLRSLPAPLRARDDDPRLHDEVVRRVLALGTQPEEREVAVLDARIARAYHDAAERRRR